MDLLEPLEEDCKIPELVARDNYSDLHLRAYVHSLGLFTAFGGNRVSALDHAKEAYQSLGGLEKQYALALVWGDGKNKMVDFMLGSDLDVASSGDDWKSAIPFQDIYVTRNGELTDIRRTCEDGIILFAHEGKIRRQAPDFQYFINNPPLLGLIGLRVDTQ